MARYDRIAPLPSPAREAVFPGWLVLRDLEGRERDGDLARRARLRFLALRPLHRILTAGLDGVSAASFAREIEGVREELGHLPARDPERLRLSRYLHEIERRSPLELAMGATGLGEVVEDAGHVFAAEEFYRTALELAERLEIPLAATAALRRLGALCGAHGRYEEAESHLSAAAAAADTAGARLEWARAITAAALLALRQGETTSARAALVEVQQRGRDWGDAGVRSVADATQARVALAAGDTEAALEGAWTALESAPDAATRTLALLVAGEALRALGLYEAATRCHDLVLQEAPGAADRWLAQGELAATLAEAGRVEDFLAVRRQALRDARAEPPAPAAAALLHLRLARACLLTALPDFARDHLRDGLEAARRCNDAARVAELESLLTILERQSARELIAPRAQPGERARLIADTIQARGAPAGRA